MLRLGRLLDSVTAGRPLLHKSPVPLRRRRWLVFVHAVDHLLGQLPLYLTQVVSRAQGTERHSTQQPMRLSQCGHVGPWYVWMYAGISSTPSYSQLAVQWHEGCRLVRPSLGRKLSASSASFILRAWSPTPPGMANAITVHKDVQQFASS